ncbi:MULTISPECIES: 2-C-methyl-D-erythritol 4-phosphate cytidylyltransferase [Mesobacillus]|uniref:2-C-methyl-D-erythritol 4-phosphate cytidylyltransferase n=2 Tax=Mesobacillus TaxID=2675231 RepID=A0A0D6ZAE5_9BACI|nr:MULTISPECIES: 2-C-methyl-D-erythritol 4-phosphate cytidylyltransferase [Mesobacillus]KIY22305.1 2-C-methyl-D-erythritol 4-phosphate cytidylyltransferase [Mesobacillus subterraneus]MDQ0415750.1 2-C-methyl-D-erythritol 4-phosphate cytidylyltransferase [Mesobacillus stamsii]
MSYHVIIPAAGLGKRMGAGINKLLLTLDAIPILIHTLKVFEADPRCSDIILAAHPDDEQAFKSLLKEHGIQKVSSLVTGGKERQDSVYNGLMALNNLDEIVLVHDGARPFIEIETIHKLVDAANKDGAAIVAVPVKDTIKKATDNQVIETIERSSLWSVQTPQAFRSSVLLEAHNKAAREQFIGTDESSLVERIPHPVSIIEGNYDNIKLTTPVDLYFAEAILRKWKESGI